MTSSGTYNTFLISDILEEAYERCGLEMKSGYDLRTGVRSFNFLMAEWANRGLNMWTFEQDTISLTPGTASYTLPANTVDIIEYEIRTMNSDGTTQDIAIERMSVSQYAVLANKQSAGRPNQIFVQRSANDTPTVTLWPVPDSVQPYTLVYWRMRRIQEAGSIGNTADMPFRFIPALVSGLAYYIAVKKAPERAQPLKMVYDEAFELAAAEDRDRASMFLKPDIMGYDS